MSARSVVTRRRFTGGASRLGVQAVHDGLVQVRVAFCYAGGASRIGA